MLYISSFDELRPDVGQLRRNLHALREAHPMGDSENLGPLVGVSGDVVRKWRTGKLKPRLESLGKLSGALGLRGIHQLFLSERDFLRRVVLQKNLPLRFNARPEYRSIETDYQIERLLAAMLTGEVETMSRSQIASRFSVSEGYLTYNFGAELRMLSQKHRNRKVYEKELRDKDPQVIVYRAVSHRISRSRTTNSDGVLADVPTNRLRHLVNLTESQLETMIFQAEEKRSKKEKSS